MWGICDARERKKKQKPMLPPSLCVFGMHKAPKTVKFWCCRSSTHLCTKHLATTVSLDTQYGCAGTAQCEKVCASWVACRTHIPLHQIRQAKCLWIPGYRVWACLKCTMPKKVVVCRAKCAYLCTGECDQRCLWVRSAGLVEVHNAPNCVLQVWRGGGACLHTANVKNWGVLKSCP